jgi:hypothetical protein
MLAVGICPAIRSGRSAKQIVLGFTPLRTMVPFWNLTSFAVWTKRNCTFCVFALLAETVVVVVEVVVAPWSVDFSVDLQPVNIPKASITPIAWQITRNLLAFIRFVLSSICGD